MNTSENKKKQITLTVLGGIFLLILVIGASFSYFQIIVNNNTSPTTITGGADLIGQATLTTNISALKLNITAEMMHISNANTTYYATEDGVPVTTAIDGSGIYTLATASLTESDVPVYCTYTYDITATSSKTISDGSDVDYKVVITESNGTETTYTLVELLSGVTHKGNIKALTYGTNQTIKIKAYVTNTESNQNDLSGNTITITITPKSGNTGFSCDTKFDIAKVASGKDFAQFLVDNNTDIDGLWSSGLEGDGYRYVGSGSYDSATTPNNLICFGTIDKTECKNNEAKYMYRIIGVFEGSDGKQHLKLISLKQLGAYAWHSDSSTDTDWADSALYAGLNGEYFLTNTTYDYLQNSTWLNKIEDWTWSAVNTLTYESSGPNYYNSLTPSEIYLHEMNRSSKTSTIGEWTTPTGKIGLMYVSDYTLSLGDNALAITGGTYNNRATLKTGWMHPSNNDTSANTAERTLSRFGVNDVDFYAWLVLSDGRVYSNNVRSAPGVRPVFHLTSDVKISSGSGEYSDPYIINE